MDFTVKDLDSQINAAMPEPKFSIGSNWKIVLRQGFQIDASEVVLSASHKTTFET